MKAICVDDEGLILQRTVSLMKKTNKFESVESFMNPEDALSYASKDKVDIALLDIDMPQMTGLELATRLKKKCPGIKIVFLTGYSEYAIEAYALHATGYLLKPINYEKLLSEIEYALDTPGQGEDTESSSRVKIETFGYFNVIADGKPVVFKRSKSRELLACLVDRQGHFISRKDLFYILWEEEDYDRAKQKYFDTIIRSLKKTLEEYNIEDILETEQGMMRVVPEKVDCDLYRFLDDDEDAIESFRGEYLSAYYWASETEGYLSDMI